MFSSIPITRLQILVSLIIALAVVTTQWLSITEDVPTVVFCDVGQGDATYIRLPHGVDVVIDGGPDSSLLNCLGKHMPFFDRVIEFAIITHPQKDHYYGFIPASKRYTIKKLFVSPTTLGTSTYQKLLTTFSPATVTKVFAGQRLILPSTSLTFLAPSRSYLASQNSTDPNDYSLIADVRIDEFRFLLTGDATQSLLRNLPQEPTKKTAVLKVPHHGSRNGLMQSFLQVADPAVAVISLGRGNSYGHPHKEVLDMLKASDAYIYRTDQVGDVVVSIFKGKLSVRAEKIQTVKTILAK